MAVETRYFSDNDIRSVHDHLAYRQDLPQNTSADANNTTVLVGKVQNALDIVVRCYEDITIADGQTGSIKLQSSSDNGVLDAWADVATIFSVAPVGADYTANAGDELARYTVSTDKELYFKAVLTTDDAAADGAVNIYVALITR